MHFLHLSTAWKFKAVGFNKSTALNFKLNPRKSAEVDKKVLKFEKVYMRTHRRSGLLISKFAL